MIFCKSWPTGGKSVSVKRVVWEYERKHNNIFQCLWVGKWLREGMLLIVVLKSNLSLIESDEKTIWLRREHLKIIIINWVRSSVKMKNCQKYRSVRFF